MKKYYEAYEDRYRAVYRQGVKYWSDFPCEVQEDLAGLDSFLDFAGASPGIHRILEPGCGDAGSFDLVLDNKFLHMLVVDQDRRRYLTSLRRVLKPGAYIMFNELYQDGAYSGPVESFEQYLEIFKPDLTQR